MTPTLQLLAADSARVGDSVRITMRVVNTGDETLELHLLGREIAYDIVVRDDAGLVVWRRLEGAFTQGILRLELLAPRQSFDLEATWVPTAPGTYRVEGILPTDEPQPLRTRIARVRVTSGG